MSVALVGDRIPAGREVDGPGLVARAGDVRRAVGLRNARERRVREEVVVREMEVVNRPVVVDLELVGALRQGLAVELLAVRVAHVDLEVWSSNRGRQRRQRERVRADVLRRVCRGEAKDVVAAALAHDVEVTAGVLAERGREGQARLL